jgi:hypothetical protein
MAARRDGVLMALVVVSKIAAAIAVVWPGIAVTRDTDGQGADADMSKLQLQECQHYNGNIS